MSACVRRGRLRFTARCKRRGWERTGERRRALTTDDSTEDGRLGVTVMRARDAAERPIIRCAGSGSSVGNKTRLAT